MELRGYSGCDLEIITNSGIKQVRKTAADISYNTRLSEQKRKQETVKLGKLRNCKTYDCGFRDGLYFFTMEYINGNTLAEQVENIQLSDMKHVVDCLTSHFSDFEKIDADVNNKFIEKIKQVKEMISKREIIERDCTEINESIQILENYKWDWVIHSQCHGDMTLENILVASDGLYLIDFLDSFYDTWMIDAAKLLQDCECFWSYRKKEISTNMKVRLLVFKDLCVERIVSMKNGKELMDTVYHILLLNLLRILPYTKTEEDYIFLKSNIASTNKKLRGYGL